MSNGPRTDTRPLVSPGPTVTRPYLCEDGTVVPVRMLPCRCNDRRGPSGGVCGACGDAIPLVLLGPGGTYRYGYTPETGSGGFMAAVRDRLTAGHRQAGNVGANPRPARRGLGVVGLCDAAAVPKSWPVTKGERS